MSQAWNKKKPAGTGVHDWELLGDLWRAKPLTVAQKYTRLADLSVVSKLKDLILAVLKSSSFINKWQTSYLKFQIIALMLILFITH